MAKTPATKESSKKTTTDKDAPAQPARLSYLTDVNDLPRRERGPTVLPWLDNAPVNAVFSPKWLVDNGVYKTPSAAVAALVRNTRTKQNPQGRLTRENKGVYRKVA